MHVITVEVPQLGNRCHLVHDGHQALVVDPPRDFAPVERVAERHEVQIAAVADTHVHNDYVSGALALARRHGADYLLSADESVAFERVGVRDGDVVTVGGLAVRVIDTPGHTRHHQSFLVGSDASPTPALFSGGSLLLGTVGRTDLVDDLLTHDLARRQWASARTLASLHPSTSLHPTHGFGSFCASSTPSDGSGTTIGEQLATNPALTLDRDTFVAGLVAGFGPVPAYYAHMASLNRAGAGRRVPRPARQLNADELAAALARGAWVVDLRARGTYAEGHLPGSVSIEFSTQFATYVGWLVPWATHQAGDLVVVTDDVRGLAPALRDLAGIGIDGVAIHVVADRRPLISSYPRTDWAGFRDHLGGPAEPGRDVVVDVRQRDEWAAGHLPGAVHVPVQDVEAAATQLPPGRMWVYCRSGYRAGIAASILHRAGRDVVHVDDDWSRVAELAIPTASGVAA